MSPHPDNPAKSFSHHHLHGTNLEQEHLGGCFGVGVHGGCFFSTPSSTRFRQNESSGQGFGFRFLFFFFFNARG
jgi:hypothetical protein